MVAKKLRICYNLLGFERFLNTEENMDNFMEKLTHKFTPSEVIRANSQAEAAEMESKKEQIRMFENQMEKVDNAISDIRELNLKNIEAVQDIQNMAKTSSERIEASVGRMESETVSMIKETSDISIAGINKTVDESLARIEKIKADTDSTDAINAGIAAVIEKMEKSQRELEDRLHADHVKVYRNVQASLIEELDKRTTDIKRGIVSKGLVVTLLVVTLLVAGADLAVNVLKILGIL